jgi:galactose mutarotase-like enzyme
MNRRDFLFSVGLGASTAAFNSSTFTFADSTPGIDRWDRYKDTPSFVIENDIIRAEFVAAGGRMVSLRDKHIGHEFLFQQKEVTYVRGDYDSPMALNQAAGYDDMFPTIAECYADQQPWKGIRMPDHGEVWSLDWNVEKAADSLTLSLHGVRLPYRFTRRVTLPSAQRLRMAYTVDNLSSFVMPYLWSAHAMLRPEEGARILLPEECREAVVGASQSGRLGKYGDHITWPNWTDAQGRRHDLSMTRSPHSDDVSAYTFARPLAHGMCSLRWPSVNRTLALSFPVETVPFLTVLVGEGLKNDPRFFVLLEPCSAPFGRLDMTHSYARDSKVPANGRREWYLDFEIQAS